MKKLLFHMIPLTVFLFNIAFAGATAIHEMNVSETFAYSIDELMDLTSAIAAERIGPQDVDFRVYENLHMHPHYEPTMTDSRYALFFELAELFCEAQSALVAARGYSELPTVVISHLSPPSEFRRIFQVGFTHERYFHLTDFILDFVGMNEYMIEFIFAGPIIWGPAIP